MSRIRLRHIVLFLLLVISIGAALWIGNRQSLDEETVVVPSAREGKGGAPAIKENQRLALDRLNHRKSEGTDIDPFQAKSWFVPPPPAPVIVPPPPPKPTAPPLPFQYSGKSEDAGGGNVMVYLSKGNESFAVKPGENFAGVYQFEGIEKGKLVILYVPLSEKQYLSIGQIE